MAAGVFAMAENGKKRLTSQMFVSLEKIRWRG
jgi:hypothetical protein